MKAHFFPFLYILCNVFRPTYCLSFSVSSLSYIFSYVFFCSLSVRVLQSSFLYYFAVLPYLHEMFSCCCALVHRESSEYDITAADGNTA